LTEEEIRNTIFAMNCSKAPRPGLMVIQLVSSKEHDLSLIGKDLVAAVYIYTCSRSSELENC
jgi:hypothetical protein